MSGDCDQFIIGGDALAINAGPALVCLARWWHNHWGRPLFGFQAATDSSIKQEGDRHGPY